MNWEVKKYPAYYRGVKQVYPNEALAEFSQSRSTVVGNLVFLSGLNGRDLFTGKVEAKTIEGQMVVALDKLRLAMEQAGSSLSNLVETMIYIRNLNDYPGMRTAEVQYYQKNAPNLVEEPPASSCLNPPALGDPDYLVEIDAFGVISPNMYGWEVKKNPMYYLGVRQNYPNIGMGEAQFSRTVVVGNLIFLSGMAGRSPITGKVDTDNVEDHMAIALGKLKIAMEEAGSSMNNVIRTVYYIKNVEDYSRIRKAEVEFYQRNAPILVEEPPITTVIQGNLYPPHYLVEISAMGVVSSNRPDWPMKKYPAYYADVRCTYPHVALGKPTFSKAIRVSNLIFCTCTGSQASDAHKVVSNAIEEHTFMALDNIRLTLEEAGGSMNKIAKTIIFLKNSEDIPCVRQAEIEYYKKHAPLLLEEPPCRSIMQTNLIMPGSLIEIEASGFITV